MFEFLTWIGGLLATVLAGVCILILAYAVVRILTAAVAKSWHEERRAKDGDKDQKDEP